MRRVLRLHAIQYGRVLQVPVARVTVRGWPRGGPQATWGVLLLLVALVAARGWPRGGPQAAWGVLLSSARMRRWARGRRRWALGQALALRPQLGNAVGRVSRASWPGWMPFWQVF